MKYGNILAILMANALIVWVACSADAEAIRFLEVHPDTVFITETITKTDTIIQTDTLIVTDTVCGCGMEVMLNGPGTVPKDMTRGG